MQPPGRAEGDLTTKAEGTNLTSYRTPRALVFVVLLPLPR
jgi:hypothetical protein